MYLIKARARGCVQNDSETHSTGVTGLHSQLRRSCNPVTQSRAFHCHFAHTRAFSLYAHTHQLMFSSNCPVSEIINIYKVAINITMTSWWAPWRLKSPALRLFTQPFIQAQSKENTKASRHLSLCGEFTGYRWIHRSPVNSLHKWPVTRKKVSIWWRHHEVIHSR